MKLKKLLAGFMTLAMLVTMLPATVLAAGPFEVTDAQGLQDALNAAGAANAGNTTVTIKNDIDMTGFDWTPVSVDGQHGADVVTVEGSDCKITGLSEPLFAGGFAGGSGIIINDLTIKDSKIVSANGQGSGAFIECADSMDVITLKNCHLLNSTVSGSRTGGLVGWTSGYSKQSDGPVKSYVTITDCSVIDCEITGTSVGAINGHAGASDWTFTTIKNCTIKDNKLDSTDSGDWRVGVVVGTANIGEVTIEDITESGNTLTQTGKTAPAGQSNLYGRFVPSNGKGTLTIDGVGYNSDGSTFEYVAKIEGKGQYKTLDAAFEAAQSGDEVKILTAGTYELSTSGKDITITGAVDGVVFDNIGAKDMGGANVTFNNVTFDYYPNVNYTGLQHSGNLEYNNCTINGQVFLYGMSDTFNNCTFNQTENAYNVWTYTAGKAKFTDCTFKSAGKAVLIYNEGGRENPEVEFTKCTFNASETRGDKAAIEINSGSHNCVVTITDCTVSDTFDTPVTGHNLEEAKQVKSNVWHEKEETNSPVTTVTDIVIDGTKTTVTTNSPKGNHTVVINEITTPVTPPTPDDPTDTPDDPTGTPDDSTDKPKKSSSKKYDINIDLDDVKNGDVDLNVTRAKKNQGVQITVTPDAGYELDEIKVLDGKGNELKLRDLGNGVYEFSMPKGEVDIEVSFREAEEAPAVKDTKEIVLTIDSSIVMVNGDPVVTDAAPMIKGDKTYLPIRFIAEELGATVTWNEAEQAVTIVKGDTTIVIYIGQAFALVNGEPVQLDASAFILNDRTYLPLRFVAENLGAVVTWDGAARTVTIVAE